MLRRLLELLPLRAARAADHHFDDDGQPDGDDRQDAHDGREERRAAVAVQVNFQKQRDKQEEEQVDLSGEREGAQGKGKGMREGEW